MSHSSEKRYDSLMEDLKKIPKLVGREDCLQAISSSMCSSQKSEIIWDFNEL